MITFGTWAMCFHFRHGSVDMMASCSILKNSQSLNVIEMWSADVQHDVLLTWFCHVLMTVVFMLGWYGVLMMWRSHFWMILWVLMTWCHVLMMWFSHVPVQWHDVLRTELQLHKWEREKGKRKTCRWWDASETEFLEAWHCCETSWNVPRLWPHSPYQRESAEAATGPPTLARYPAFCPWLQPRLCRHMKNV